MNSTLVYTLLQVAWTKYPASTGSLVDKEVLYSTQLLSSEISFTIR
jgi:hypothetical protein